MPTFDQGIAAVVAPENINRSDRYVEGIEENTILAAALLNVVDASSTGMLAVEWT
jgi:hypothetical protein